MKEAVRFADVVRRHNSGNVSVEFAFICSILILLTLGTFELGRILFTYQKLAGALGGVTRMIGMNASDNAIRDSVMSRFSSAEQGALTVSIDTPVLDGVSYKRVDARYVLPLIMPGFHLFPGQSITVHSVQLVPTS
jgi:Flp pilus assembly protein TadG